ncbi:MAG: cysteine hydrolase [Chloroflexi bacterium]|nr:cysteine hydrolase [Chloroflexota bacterium]
MPGTLRVPANPYDYTFDVGSTALVVIDMQGDFLLPGGFGEVLGNDASRLRPAIQPSMRVLAAARELGMLVVHTREGHLADLSDCPPAKRLRGQLALGIGDPGPMGRILVRGEPGWEIVPELAPIAGEIVIDKPGKGAFFATPLDHVLLSRGISSLLVAGVTTEVCVQTTVREANDRGYECLVLADCTASYYPEFHEATLAMLASQGAIAGWVADSADLLAALAPLAPLVRRMRRAFAVGGAA